MNDVEDVVPSSERIAELREAGISFCQILSSGHNDECDACRAILDRKMPLDAFPGLPPDGCECVPWCRGVVIAAI